jgi:hypothetical protein
MPLNLHEERGAPLDRPVREVQKSSALQVPSKLLRSGLWKGETAAECSTRTRTNRL